MSLWVTSGQALWKEDSLWPNLLLKGTGNLMVFWVCQPGVVTNPEPDTAQGITYWGRPHIANTTSSVFCLRYFQGFLLPLGSIEMPKCGLKAQLSELLSTSSSLSPDWCHSWNPSLSLPPQALSHRVPFTSSVVSAPTAPSGQFLWKHETHFSGTEVIS